MATYVHALGFDIHSCEIIMLHVRNFRIFRDFTISLNPNFSAIFDDNTAWIEHTTYVNLFEEDGLSLKVICGKNGTGKTTIVDLISGKFDFEKHGIIVLYKDKNDNFMSTLPVKVHFNGNVVDVEKLNLMEYPYKSTANSNNIFRTDDDGSYNVQKRIGDFYLRHKALFDFESRDLFNHFSIEIWNEEFFYSEISSHIIEKYRVDSSEYDLRDYKEKNLITLVFLEISRDNTFDDFHRRNKRENNIKNVGDVIDIINIKLSATGLEYSDLNNGLSSLLSKPFRYDQYDVIHKSLFEAIDKICKYFQSSFSKMHVWENVIFSTFYIRPYLLVNEEKRYLGRLSDGEFQLTKNKFDLLFRMLQKDAIIITEDENSSYYHPEWCRSFVFSYIQAYREIKKYLSQYDPDGNYQNKFYNIVMTTHSPFIVTDLQPENLVYLTTDEQLITHEIKNNLRTFAGNISSMFYERFFMESTIGQFAKNAVEEVILSINNGTHIGEFEKAEKIINLIADDLLREILQQQLLKARHGKDSARQ